MVERSWWDNLSWDHGCQRVGWIRDKEFWQAYWRGLDIECRTAAHGTHERISRIQAHMQEAALMGNLTPFECITDKGHGQMVLRTLEEDGLLIHADAVEWFDARAWEDVPVGMVSELEGNQTANWRKLQWKAQSRDSAIYHKRTAKMTQDEVVALIVSNLKLHYYLDCDTQVRILGHAMVNAPSQWMREQAGGLSLLGALEANTNGLLDPNVDLGLIALCSGYGPNTNDVLKGIKSFGRHFTGGRTDIGNKKPRALEMSILSSLYELTSVESLYRAVLDGKMHLATSREVEMLPLNGAFDSEMGF